MQVMFGKIQKNKETNKDPENEYSFFFKFQLFFLHCGFTTFEEEHTWSLLVASISENIHLDSLLPV